MTWARGCGRLNAVISILNSAARHGRFLLIAGLIAGFLLAGVAQQMRPWLPEMIALLLLLTAIRIGPRAALGGLSDLTGGLRLLVVYQLLLPLAALGVFTALGVSGHPLALAIVLLLSAPSVTGAPNFTILLGHDPAPALQVLVLGTAIFPLTVLPVLWLGPDLGGTVAIFAAAGRLFGVIAGAVLVGFAIRALVCPDLSASGRGALDGAGAILLAVVVVALMSALGPALSERPGALLLWLGAAMVVNLGLQTVACLMLGPRPETPGRAIIAGNRNIALYLVALPDAVTDPLLIFIGCYQIPMYLTPILMRRLYARIPSEL